MKTPIPSFPNVSKQDKCKNPKITIVIPFYNAENTISRTIKSITSQPMKDLEIICVDDGSTDNSKSVIKQLMNVDKRISYVYQQNMFAGVARNNGLRLARGKYITFIDADDWIEPNSLEKLYNQANDNDIDMLKTSCQYYNLKNQTYASDNWISLKNIDNSFFHKVSNFNEYSKFAYLSDAPWSGFYKTSFLINNNICFDSLRCANDSSFFIKCLINANRIYVSDIIFVTYLINQTNSLIDIRHKYFDCQLKSFNIIEESIKHLSNSQKSLILSIFSEGICLRFWNYINNPNINLNDKKIIIKLTQNWITILDYQNFTNKDKLLFLQNTLHIDQDIQINSLRLYNKLPDITKEPFLLPKVSIVIPVYNVEQYLRQCLDSIISQTYENLEIICVNDGSTDNSLSILKEYKEKDNRIVILEQSNQGQAVARNNGVKIATGEFLYFIDSDDFVDHKCIEILCNRIQETGAEVLLNSIKLFNEETQKFEEKDWFSYKLLTNISNTCTYNNIKDDIFTRFGPVFKFYKLHFFINNNLFFPEGHFYEDVLTSIKTKLLAKKIDIIDKPLYFYRYNRPNSTMNDISKEKFDDVLIFFEQITNFIKSNNYYDILKHEFYEFINGQIEFHLGRTNNEFRYYFASKCVDFIKNNIDTNYLISNFKNPIFSLIDNPLISIIIPVFNVEHYLEKCLDSILNQTYLNLEIICIDDGSTDNSVSILDKYSNQDSRIKIFTQKNAGAAAARNLGLNNANGKYVYFMDSDDWLDLSTIEDLYQCFLKNPEIDFSTSNILCIPENETTQRISYDCNKWLARFNTQVDSIKNIPLNIRSELSPCPVNKLYRMDIINKYNIRFVEGLICEDEAWLWQYGIHCKVYYILNKTHYFYLRRANSVMGNRNESHKWLDVIDINKTILSYISKYKDIAQYTDILSDLSNMQFTDIVQRCKLEFIEDALVKIKNYKDNFIKSERFDRYYKDIKNIAEGRIRNHEINQNNILVSIIISAYNAEQYIEECLDSLINQTLHNIEIICVNDCSTDNTLHILKSYTQKDHRITIIDNENNIGCAASRNKAITIAKGSYIQFVDADDYIELDTCEKLYERASKNNCDMLSFAGINFDDKTRESLPSNYYNFRAFPNNWSKEVFCYQDCKDFITGLTVSTCLTMYKNDFIKKINLLFPEGLCFEDNLFFNKALFSAERISIDKTLYYHRRIHSKSITQNRSINYNDSLKIIDLVLSFQKSLNLTDYPYFEKYKSHYLREIIGIFNNFSEDVKKKYYDRLISLCYKYNYSADSIEYDFKIRSNGYSKLKNDSYFKLLGIAVYKHKRNPYINYHKITICGVEVYKKSNYDKTNKMSVLGIPLFKIQDKSVHKKINILGIQFYKRATPDQNTKRTYILGLPFTSKKINGYEIKRRFLCFRTKEYQWARQIVEQANHIQSIQSIQHNLVEELSNKNAILEQRVINLTEELTNVQSIAASINNEVVDLSKDIKKLNSESNSIKNTIDRNSNIAIGISCENNWADIFNNTIDNSSWLEDKSFSPGRWAVGYQFLYVMYRVLNEIKPISILELGLGQSTKMISQYVAHNEKCKHYVVEHDSNWIDFYSKNYTLPKATTVVQLPWEFVNFKDATNIRCYHNFKENFIDKKFSFISINGPLGGDMSRYARIDVLSILPNALEKDFVIMIDDTERSGEQGMISSLKEILTNNKIKFSCGEYRGAKKTTVICSESLDFVTSM